MGTGERGARARRPVHAAEEQALAKVHERQRVARSAKPAAGKEPKDAAAKKLRRARRDLEEAESQVAALEKKVGELTATLEDPALYAKADGTTEATRLGKELDRVKAELDSALQRWTDATEALEHL